MHTDDIPRGKDWNPFTDIHWEPLRLSWSSSSSTASLWKHGGQSWNGCFSNYVKDFLFYAEFKSSLRVKHSFPVWSERCLQLQVGCFGWRSSRRRSDFKTCEFSSSCFSTLLKILDENIWLNICERIIHKFDLTENLQRQQTKVSET